MKDMICIVCPRGCRLSVGEAPLHPVEGNACPRGAAYALEEIREPRRTVTATCPSLSDSPRRIPVKTTGGILRERIPALMEILVRTRVSLPVRSGDILIENWEGTGVSVVATRTLG
jgi:CxxC motif-containing protein